ncbi:MAG: hypothetical protein K8F91_08095 [Candidatus Obscuribacterales bacterium]|nr:hypothetical protein [Candidatus Obscuribacterales bacterium]
MVVGEEVSVRFEEFQKLSRGSQLLICYALHNELEELPMMGRDRDYVELLEYDWLEEKHSKIRGVRNFAFRDKVFDDLIAIKDRILDEYSEQDLDHYRESKRAYYPWLW